MAVGELVPEGGPKAELEDVVRNRVLQFTVFGFGDSVRQVVAH